MFASACGTTDVHTSKIADEACKQGPDVELVVREEIPAKEIVNYADEQGLDMIVAGTHGCSGFRQAIVRSVTDEVIGATNVPILSVHTTGDAADGDRAS